MIRIFGTFPLCVLLLLFVSLFIGCMLILLLLFSTCSISVGVAATAATADTADIGLFVALCAVGVFVVSVMMNGADDVPVGESVRSMMGAISLYTLPIELSSKTTTRTSCDFVRNKKTKGRKK